MKEVTVSVTEDDIKHGKHRCTTACPIARAIARLFPERSIAVGGMFATFYNATRGTERRAYLSPAATRFIRAYDDYQPVSPFTFTLAIPEDL